MVTGGSGVEADVMGFGATIVDMDGARYPELLLVADCGMSRYFRNNGNGTFSDLTAVSGTGLDANGMGSAVGDPYGSPRQLRERGAHCRRGAVAIF